MVKLKIKLFYLSAHKRKLIIIISIVLLFLSQQQRISGIKQSSSSSLPLKVNQKCANLPQIKPASGVFFLDSNVKNVVAPEFVSPSFRIGSYFGKSVQKHMETDEVHFQLVKELLKNKKGGLSFDMGANQGFFTWFLASLGMNVHSFEISSKNFVALQHGIHFNEKQIADNVNLYPMGLDNKVSRFDVSGKDYGGFLKESGGSDEKNVNENEGPILGVTFDCFAYHSKLDLSNVAFVKLDVEGFEIAVLEGSSNSLFTKKNKVGGMLMEVGPARWNRAHVDFATGLREMKKLESHFKNISILIRTSGAHAESCPLELVHGVLSDTNPRKIDNVNMYKVKNDEWLQLLKNMEKHDYDCNFWYTN